MTPMKEIFLEDQRSTRKMECAKVYDPCLVSGHDGKVVVEEEEGKVQE